MAKHKKARSYRRIFAVFVLLTAILAVCLEFYMRKHETYIIRQDSKPVAGLINGDPEFLIRYTHGGRRLIPNAKVIIRNHNLSRRDIIMNINSSGFRNAEIPAVKDAGGIRILALGDSITWGDYLQAEEVYVERAEHYLNEKIKTKKIEIINAGVGDIGLKEELDILEERGLAVNPDIVIVAFYMNDSRPPWGFAGETGGRGRLRRNSILADAIYKKLKFITWIKQTGDDRFRWISEQQNLNWFKSPQDFLKLASLAKYDWGAAWEPDSWDAVEGEFARLKRLSKKQGFKTAVIIFPVAYQVYADFLNNTPQEMVGKISRTYGFACLDLLPLLRQHRNQRLFYDICHPLPETNDMIGLAVADFMSNNLLAQSLK